jgi:hypothetical protein
MAASSGAIAPQERSNVPTPTPEFVEDAAHVSEALG